MIPDYDFYFTCCMGSIFEEVESFGRESGLIARSVDRSYQLWFAHVVNSRYLPETARQIIGTNGQFEIRSQHRAIYSYAHKHGFKRSNVFFLDGGL